MMDDYATKIDALRDRYEPRACAILERVAGVFRSLGWSVSEVDLSDGDEEYQWFFGAWASDTAGPRHLPDVDVRLTIVEQRVHEDDGESDGVSFALDVHGLGGVPFARVQPYNHTPECWVTGDAVEERFKLVEEVDEHDLVGGVVDRFEKEPA